MLPGRRLSIVTIRRQLLVDLVHALFAFLDEADIKIGGVFDFRFHVSMASVLLVSEITIPLSSARKSTIPSARRSISKVRSPTVRGTFHDRCLHQATQRWQLKLPRPGLRLSSIR